MSDLEKNLKVLTDHVNGLAADQQAAAGRIKIGGESVRDIAGNLWRTHGVVCAATNMAVSAVETERAAAATALYQVSADLRDKLNHAAENYNDTDWRSGRDIGACGL